MKERKRVEGEGKIHRGFPVLLFGPLVEPFRGDASSVMPERFYQASMFLLFLLFLNAVDCGPRLKSRRGDE